MMKTTLNKLKYLGYSTPVIVFLILVYVWNTTSPETIGPMGILSVFFLLYIFWASLFFLLLHFTYLFLKTTSLLRLLMQRREGRPFHWRLAYYVASILAFAPVLILAMQSVNQLTIRDVALVFLFVGLAIFYVVKRY